RCWLQLREEQQVARAHAGDGGAAAALAVRDYDAVEQGTRDLCTGALLAREPRFEEPVAIIAVAGGEVGAQGEDMGVVAGQDGVGARCRGLGFPPAGSGSGQADAWPLGGRGGVRWRGGGVSFA